MNDDVSITRISPSGKLTGKDRITAHCIKETVYLNIEGRKFSKSWFLPLDEWKRLNAEVERTS